MFCFVRSGDLYYQSALYVPSRGELFFNVYNSRESTIHQIVRGRFVANRVGVQWEDTNYNDQLTRMHVTLGFFGMFSLGQGGEQRYFGMDKSNTVFEFVYSPSGEVTFRKIVRFVISNSFPNFKFVSPSFRVR